MDGRRPPLPLMLQSQQHSFVNFRHLKTSSIAISTCHCAALHHYSGVTIFETSFVWQETAD